MTRLSSAEQLRQMMMTKKRKSTRLTTVTTTMALLKVPSTLQKSRVRMPKPSAKKKSKNRSALRSKR
jgi:hypothetical protein